MIDAPSQILKRGVDFVRNNPQIIYTLFLVVAIPVAFLFTSEKFLKVATDTQDHLEIRQGALISDVFTEFAKERFNDVAYIEERMRNVASQNETIARFSVLTASGTDLIVHASIVPEEHGSVFPFLLETEETRGLFEFAKANPRSPFYAYYSSQGVRYIRTVRTITITVPVNGDEQMLGYMVIDFAMSQADSTTRDRMRNAYITLVIVVLSIIILLGRQARIIDYASLYARLKEVDGMKDDFVSMAAHELRSPLTIIRGYVEMLGEGEGMPDASKVHLQHIDRAALQLNSLVGDILDVSKLQEGRMSFTFVTLDVSTEIAQVVDSFIRPAEDKGLKLLYTPSPLPPLSVDTDRFRQLMINLVGNAIKYTPQGEVRVTAAADAEHVTIRVSDTGMGISAEDQQKLFQKFFRVKSRETEKITGTGLGLWITTQIVKAMRGTISVESIKGKGTDFIVTFPIAK